MTQARHFDVSGISASVSERVPGVSEEYKRGLADLINRYSISPNTTSPRTSHALKQSYNTLICEHVTLKAGEGSCLFELKEHSKNIWRWVKFIKSDKGAPSLGK